MTKKTYDYAKLEVSAKMVAPKYKVYFISCHSTMASWECVFQGPAGNFIISVKNSEMLVNKHLLTKILDTKISEQYPELAL